MTRKSDSPNHLQAARLIRHICQAFEKAELEYVVIGGQAVIRHGHVRATEDVDFTVVAPPFDRGDQVISILNTLGLDPLVDDPGEFVRKASLYRCADPRTGFGIDVSFVDSAYLKQALGRALVVETDGHPVPFLGLEDVLVHKVIAARPQDQIDAVELIARYPEFDREYVEHWLGAYEEILEEPLIAVLRAWRDEALK